MTIKLNWGTGIALTYTAFALSTLAFVIFALGRPVALVRADYYEQSLKQDRRIDAVRSAAALGTAVSLRQTDGRHVAIAIPRAQAALARGTVTLYRASDAAADRTVDFSPDSQGRQIVSLSGMVAGHWILQLAWSASGRDYYVERALAVE